MQVSECRSFVRKKNAIDRKKRHLFGWMGGFCFCVEQKSICCGSMDVLESWVFNVLLKWEANGKRRNIHKMIQHFNYGFLSKLTEHRAHELTCVVLIWKVSMIVLLWRVSCYKSKGGDIWSQGEILSQCKWPQFCSSMGLANLAKTFVSTFVFPNGYIKSSSDRQKTMDKINCVFS